MTKRGEGELKNKGAQAPGDAQTHHSEAETVPVARAEYEELLRKVGELNTLQDRLLRSAADFDNARKRLAKEREDFLKFALEGFIRDLLPVVDHFELALSHLDACDDKIKPVRDGFVLIQKQWAGFLAEHGLKRIETLGQHFDPHVHEAVGQIISPDREEGIVLEEMLAGYLLNGKLLRPAKVKISAKEQVPTVEKTEELT